MSTENKPQHLEVVKADPHNPFAVEKREDTGGAMTEAFTSRQAQEVQAAMVIAKQFPRDEAAAWNRIMKSWAVSSMTSATSHRLLSNSRESRRSGDTTQ